MRNVYERTKMVIEPSAGVGPAVLFSSEFKELRQQYNLKNIAVVLCGGNIDLSLLKTLF